MRHKWPADFDWQQWVDRFDRMQERYTLAREERFEMIVRIIRAVRPTPRRVLDLGCGAGSLSERVLTAFPGCALVGIDLDESLLGLAAKRLGRFGQRVQLLCEDLRTGDWLQPAGGEFDAVVSATALHWLSAEHLADLYRRVASVLCHGGIFLNADHVGSDCPAIQAEWQQGKKQELASRDYGSADTWPAFWNAYAAALGADINRIGSNVVGPWEGVEEGMPLSWHFDRLRSSGLSSPECFWRRHGDAIYGAIRGERT